MSTPAVRVLWHHLYEDGPLNGLALWGDQKVWFECTDKYPDLSGGSETDTADDEWKRRTFALYSLTPENLATIESQQEQFRSAIGYCNEHTPGEYQPRKNFNVFFSRVYINPEGLLGEVATEVVGTQMENYFIPREFSPT